jgi:hypothetical protein
MDCGVCSCIATCRIACCDRYFNEWLRSTDVPSYGLSYSLSPGDNGSTTLEGKLTQSGVSPSFRMLVPVFAELAGKNYRVGVVALKGTSTGECKAVVSGGQSRCC